MQTLVLDVAYQPHSRVPWETAIVWVLERAAEVVEEYPEKYIRTVNWSVKMPSIVRLVKSIPRKKAVKFSRRGVYTRDKGRCGYCQRRLSLDNFTYDHVVPRAQGGATTWQNVIAACQSCNQKKAGRTPQQAGMRLLVEPVKPKSLPSMPRHIRFTDGMPESWRDWLRSEAYWTAELENDN